MGLHQPSSVLLVFALLIHTVATAWKTRATFHPEKLLKSAAFSALDKHKFFRQSLAKEQILLQYYRE